MSLSRPAETHPCSQHFGVRVRKIGRSSQHTWAVWWAQGQPEVTQPAAAGPGFRPRLKSSWALLWSGGPFTTVAFGWSSFGHSARTALEVILTLLQSLGFVHAPWTIGSEWTKLHQWRLKSPQVDRVVFPCTVNINKPSALSCGLLRCEYFYIMKPFCFGLVYASHKVYSSIQSYWNSHSFFVCLFCFSAFPFRCTRSPLWGALVVYLEAVQSGLQA